MGQSPSKDPIAPTSTSNAPQKPEELVDFGSLLPQGVYPSSASDFDYRVVRRLIQERRLAPFYKGLADEPEDLFQNQDSPEISPAPSPPSSHSMWDRNTSVKGKDKEAITARQKREIHRIIYKAGAIECPICFLYYPDNTNHTRCCDQPICTECFIQIHRPPESPATPASCPFCVEPNFGVIYRAPEWSTINKRTPTSALTSSSMSREGSTASGVSTSSGVSGEKKHRRKSVSHKDPEVVTVDIVRPDWNRPLLEITPRSRSGSRRNSTSSAGNSGHPGLVARRIGGRPTSTLVTSTGSTRSRAASATSSEYGGYVTSMRHMNMDLEELMVMEAIRMSLLEQEAREAKEREERAKKQAEEAEDQGSNAQAGPSNSLDNPDEEDAPTITISEHIDIPTSSSSTLPSWSRNKAMPPPPPHENAGSSSAAIDYKPPIQEVSETGVGQSDSGNVF